VRSGRIQVSWEYYLACWRLPRSSETPSSTDRKTSTFLLQSIRGFHTKTLQNPFLTSVLIMSRWTRRYQLLNQRSSLRHQHTLLFQFGQAGERKGWKINHLFSISVESKQLIFPQFQLYKFPVDQARPHRKSFPYIKDQPVKLQEFVKIPMNKLCSSKICKGCIGGFK